ncbi:tetratricopeptide repeat protein [Variovorax sp. J22P271]|uniref:O-linked N-acetylglucosamine transferase, SPINDLY family protein n=1 Tax=Variovorax davisae TaxID=3053515 RepID=UPI0025758C52|nr:tetratricopeptide repeat protein [Variovorax sp. J22P271]MDM0030843.1 tetratricopeptide repeat protein [Variovorax sp. J22P271]
MQLVAQAERHFRAGQVALAETLLRQAIERDPRQAKAYELLAYICGNRQDLADCEDFLQKAAALPGCSAEALFYLGRVQAQRDRPVEAAAAFARSLKLAGPYFEGLHELGVAYGALSAHDQALDAFRRAERLNAQIPELQSNLAGTLAALHRFGDALPHYDRALALDPLRVDDWTDRGAALTELGRGAEALESYRRALSLAPEDVPAWMNQATTLTLLKRPAEALASYDRVARLAPQWDYLAGHRLHAAMAVCQWQGWAQQVERVVARVEAGDKAATPFTLMPMPASAATLLQCARTYARDLYPSQPAAAPALPRDPARRLRIGYFSSDFRNHPMSQLIARVLECHDRERFETFGFALGSHPMDAVGARVAAALEHFSNVAARSDAEIAALARGAGIDIAVDLNGFSEGGRPSIFAGRAAPVQVNYLGFPGSMGCDYMDYILADATVIPEDDVGHYAEKVAWLPDSYFPNDDTKAIGSAPGGRAEMGLPPEAAVFACFNSNHKITPDVFDVWMRLLREVPRSVLWLLKSNAEAQRALGAEAALRGVDPQRLVWAERMPLADHLARHRHADLFLDTFHYNAHTTCCDALWGGLPVLTLAGTTFASRVGASLLAAVGLPELVTRDVAAYERLAIELATSPLRLADLRQRLAQLRTCSPLFDSERFARRLESAFDAMWQRQRQGLAPDHLRIAG